MADDTTRRTHVGTLAGRTMDPGRARDALLSYTQGLRPQDVRELRGYWSKISIAAVANSMDTYDTARYIAGNFDTATDDLTKIVRLRETLANTVANACQRAQIKLEDVLPPVDTSIQMMAELADRVSCERPYPDEMVRILINWSDEMTRISTATLNKRVSDQRERAQASDPEIIARLARIESLLTGFVQESKRAAESHSIDHTKMVSGIRRVLSDINVNGLVTYRALMYVAGAAVYSARREAARDGTPFTVEDMSKVGFENYKNFRPGTLLGRIAPKIVKRLMELHKLAGNQAARETQEDTHIDNGIP